MLIAGESSTLNVCVCWCISMVRYNAMLIAGGSSELNVCVCIYLWLGTMLCLEQEGLAS